MKCKICGKRTNWDHSVGHIDFLVCTKCFDSLTKFVEERNGKVFTLDLILKMGKLAEKESEAER